MKTVKVEIEKIINSLSETQRLAMKYPTRAGSVYRNASERTIFNRLEFRASTKRALINKGLVERGYPGRFSELGLAVYRVLERRTDPMPHYAINQCDTHNLWWEGTSLEVAEIEARCALPSSEYYLTETFGTGEDDDEIIRQVSLDEWLHEIDESKESSHDQ